MNILDKLQDIKTKEVLNENDINFIQKEIDLYNKALELKQDIVNKVRNFNYSIDSESSSYNKFLNDYKISYIDESAQETLLNRIERYIKDKYRYNISLSLYGIKNISLENIKNEIIKLMPNESPEELELIQIKKNFYSYSCTSKLNNKTITLKNTWLVHYSNYENKKYIDYDGVRGFEVIFKAIGYFQIGVNTEIMPKVYHDILEVFKNSREYSHCNNKTFEKFDLFDGATLQVFKNGNVKINFKDSVEAERFHREFCVSNC